METTIKTSIQCNFITKNNPEHSYPGGLPEFNSFSQYQSPTIIKLLTWHPVMGAYKSY